MIYVQVAGLLMCKISLNPEKKCDAGGYLQQ